MHRPLHVALLALVITADAHGLSTFEDAPAGTTFVVSSSLTASSLCFSLANAVLLARGERPSRSWTVGGMISAGTSIVVGLGQILFGVVSTQFNERDQVTGDQILWMSTGGTSIGLGLFGALFAALATSDG